MGDSSERYGVEQERDWNRLSNDEFRDIIRSEFESNYPPELRYAPGRLRWAPLAPWYRHMAAKGWIAPAWPTAFGGMGLEAAKLLIFFEEQERWGIARYPDHGVLMIGPLLTKYGTRAQRERFLPGILTCDDIWCQGYSEPEAGSDLASLRTRAVVKPGSDGDTFIINGQKTWTTLAQDATHIFLLARTNPEARPQAGISFILADIKTPGIVVRPIRDIAGHEEFCEVFLDNVAVPVANMIGQMNDGWTVAKSLLGFERIALGSPKLCESGLQSLLRIARLFGKVDDPVFRDRFSRLQLDVAHLGDAYRVYAGRLIRGESLGPEISMLKIWSTETFQKIADLGIEAAGAAASLSGNVSVGDEETNIIGAWYKARPSTIYGGSNEIQRNIIAQRVLHLPVPY